MNSVISFFAEFMMPWAKRISEFSYLQAMRDSFAILLPFIFVASFFGVVEWVLLDPWGTVMGARGLNMGAVITGLEQDSPDYKNCDFVRSLQVVQGMCNMVVTVGFGLLSLLMVVSLAYRLGLIWGGPPFITALTALGAFVIITPQTVGGVPGFDLQYFGNRGMLSAIIVATSAAKTFICLSKNKKLVISMPPSVPQTVAKSFAVLLPVLITMWCFALFALFLQQMDFMGTSSLNELIYALLQAPLMGVSQGLGFSLLFQGLTWLLWWMGIHGHHVTAAIQNMVYVPAQLANQTGEGSYIISNGFFEAGLLHVLGFLFAILLFSQRESWRAVAKISLPAMLFNIQEPLLFGLPIMLNPLLLVPYILAPLVNTIVGWLAMSMGLVPIFKYVVPWTMPLFAGGVISTGSLAGGILQLVWLLIDILIYAPFVVVANRVNSKQHTVSSITDGD
ncbi:PTS system, cellobiose-specific IIC component [Selenomonas ruminantium]|uniref:Permease IIC component n=1 Tax=Selenomonas ruminantium TaxID=971 RepID=A0A1M6SEL1_SELRU|nr:PTS transporter subunit EIIC [Selenomonas ruminantium]SHK42997.1 PTS system, cellobiose-specific IIC component [Selenomonas ruminantium]